MRTSIFISILFLSLFGFAQNDSASIDKVLKKLTGMEKLRHFNDSVRAAKLAIKEIPAPKKVIKEAPPVEEVELIAKPSTNTPIKTNRIAKDTVVKKPVVRIKETVVKDTIATKTVAIIEKDSVPSKGVAIIKFDKRSYELGSIDQGKIVVQKFTFTNTGTGILYITGVAPDCSCTSPEWSKDPIKPGEHGYVIATYDSKGDMGKFLKTITVIHNSEKGHTFLDIRGFVAPKL